MAVGSVSDRPPLVPPTRIEATVSTDASPWSQTTLFPPDVVEIRLRVGVVRSSDHLQWQLEAWSATDDTLLSMEATPHRSMAEASTEIVTMYEQLGTLLYNLCGPF